MIPFLRALLGHLQQVLLEVELGVLNVGNDCDFGELIAPYEPPRLVRYSVHIPSPPDTGWGFFCFANSALAWFINFCLLSYSCFSCSALCVAVIVLW